MQNIKKTIIRDKKWLAEVRGMNCIRCGATPCDPAHFRAGLGGGVGMKPGDDLVAPLCRPCHDIQHRTSERHFWMAELNNWVFASKCIRAYLREIYNERKII